MIENYDRYEWGFRILYGVSDERMCIHCGHIIPQYADRPNQSFEHILIEHDDNLDTETESHIGYTCLECDDKIGKLPFGDTVELFKSIIEQK